MQYVIGEVCSMSPLVSIVTPCYNGEVFLGRYFASILDQSYTNLEIIFVNDGSDDETGRVAEEFVQKFSAKGIHFVYLKQETNKGQAAALNTGLKYIQGEYFIWPDADDELTPDSIRKRVEFLENNSEFDYCAGTVECVQDADGKKTDLYLRHYTSDRISRIHDLIFGEIMMPGSYMMRTAFLDRVIRNREIYCGAGGQNPQLLIPAAWFGNMGTVEDIVYIYHIRNDSHSHSIDSGRRIIEQLQRYEKICIETIRRLEDPSAEEIIPKIRSHYAKRKYGNAVDTMDASLIHKYYLELLDNGSASLHDRLLHFKYTDPVARFLFGVHRS